jgi:hypothetical protein
MSVFKEAMYAVRQLKPQQTRIYEDACDYGIPIKTLNDPALRLAKGLIEQYFVKGEDTRKVEHYSTGATVTVKLGMVDEFGDGHEFPLEITYVSMRTSTNTRFGKIIGYLYIDDKNVWA